LTDTMSTFMLQGQPTLFCSQKTKRHCTFELQNIVINTCRKHPSEIYVWWRLNTQEKDEI